MSFALCLAFGAKIKSVIEPDGVENFFHSFKKLFRPESYILSLVLLKFMAIYLSIYDGQDSENPYSISSLFTL